MLVLEVRMASLPLDAVAALVVIATGATGVTIFGIRFLKSAQRRRRLEDYLKDEKGMGHDEGQRSVPNLMRHLRMTEREVLEAAFQSKVVQPRTRQDDQGHADKLLFVYDDDTEEVGPRSRRRF